MFLDVLFPNGEMFVHVWIGILGNTCISHDY